MILVDTSSWVEFFRKKGRHRVKERVAHSIRLDEIVLTCPVEFELLAGCRPSERSVLEEAFDLCKRETFVNADWRSAAALENDLRGQGLTIPRDDLFVAAVALRLDLPVLCFDRHFDWIRERARPSLRVDQLA